MDYLTSCLGGFVAAFFVLGVSSAQTITSAAGAVAPLSALGASARAEALGDAFVGLADDPSAVFFNPAGLSQLRAADFSLNHNSYLAGSFEETLLFGLPAGSLGGFAGALQYVNWGGLDQRDAFGVPQGTFTDGDAAFSLGWGASFAPGLSFGVALRGVQQKIIDSLYTGLTGDLGLLLAPYPNVRLGLSYSGLGTQLEGFAPAQDLRLGLSTILYLGRGNGPENPFGGGLGTQWGEPYPRGFGRDDRKELFPPSGISRRRSVITKSAV